jgi:hypothetical protein
MDAWAASYGFAFLAIAVLTSRLFPTGRKGCDSVLDSSIHSAAETSQLSTIAIGLRAASVYINAVGEHRRWGCHALAVMALRKAEQACVCAGRAIDELVLTIPEAAALRVHLEELCAKLTTFSLDDASSSVAQIPHPAPYSPPS